MTLLAYATTMPSCIGLENPRVYKAIWILENLSFPDGVHLKDDIIMKPKRATQPAKRGGRRAKTQVVEEPAPQQESTQMEEPAPQEDTESDLEDGARLEAAIMEEEDVQEREVPGYGGRTMTRFSLEEEEEMLQWVEAHPILFSKSVDGFKDVGRKTRLIDQFCRERRMEVADFNRWWKTVRSAYGRLISPGSKASGSGRAVVTARSRWLLQSCSFLKSHITPKNASGRLGSFPASRSQDQRDDDDLVPEEEEEPQPSTSTAQPQAPAPTPVKKTVRTRVEERLLGMLEAEEP